MSYARVGADSDVYVYSDGEELNCVFCSLSGGGAFSTKVPVVMKAHLDEHVKTGDKVPAYCMSRLENDVAAGGIIPLSEGSVKISITISPEAMAELFAPLAPCPECQRPLPDPFNDDYQHWDGCSVGALEKARAEMHCLACGGPCQGPCEEGDLQFESSRKEISPDE